MGVCAVEWVWDWEWSSDGKGWQGERGKMRLGRKKHFRSSYGSSGYIAASLRWFRDL